MTDNNWVEHDGGECPLKGTDLVEVKTTETTHSEGCTTPAKMWAWLSTEFDHVTHYRLDGKPAPVELSSNDWIEHKSGLRPCGQYIPVDVQTPAGRTIRGGIAGDYYWGEETGHRYTVARWRLAEPHGGVWIKYDQNMLRPVSGDALVDIKKVVGCPEYGLIASEVHWAAQLPDGTPCVTHYRLSGDPVEQSSGGDNDYWVVDITNPKRMEPCRVECEDVILALGMTFGEGEAFKAIWRGCAARKGNGKPGDTAKRNAEKVVHYGEYMKRDALDG